MRFLTNKRSKSLLIAGLSLACLGSFGTAVWAASHPQPPAINAQGQRPPGPPPDSKFGGMQESSNDASSLTAVKTVDGNSLNLVGQNLASTGTNENVLLVRKGGSLTLTDSQLSKTGDSSSADASNFTGQNAF